MGDRKYLTAEEVAQRYRGAVSVGTLGNWRAMRVGPAFVKIGKAVLYAVCCSFSLSCRGRENFRYWTGVRIEKKRFREAPDFVG